MSSEISPSGPRWPDRACCSLSPVRPPGGSTTRKNLHARRTPGRTVLSAICGSLSASPMTPEFQGGNVTRAIPTVPNQRRPGRIPGTSEPGTVVTKTRSSRECRRFECYVACPTIFLRKVLKKHRLKALSPSYQQPLPPMPPAGEVLQAVLAFFRLLLPRAPGRPPCRRSPASRVPGCRGCLLVGWCPEAARAPCDCGHRSAVH